MHQIWNNPLSGSQAHLQMAPYDGRLYITDLEGYRKAAVLIPLSIKNEELILTMIRRSKRPGDRHGGQMAFPGGAVEPNDLSRLDTALRETYEEIGLSTAIWIQTRALNTLWVPVSKFVIAPFIGYTDIDLSYSRQASEVAEIIEIPVRHLLDTSNVGQTTGGHAAYLYKTYEIWGASAMILSEFLALLD